MLPIPENVAAQFNEVLQQRAIQEPFLAFYSKWLRYFLDFCRKYPPSVAKSEQIRLFIEKLRSKNQTPQQYTQAAHAISLFLESQQAKNSPHSESAAAKPPPPARPAYQPLKSQNPGGAARQGRCRREWQDRAEILVRFSAKKRDAVDRYRQFVADGIARGQREELTGGGLRRSAGGWEGLQVLRRAGEYWRGDERILGDGNFVNAVLQAAEESLTRGEKFKWQGWDLHRLVVAVCEMLTVAPEDLQKKGRANSLSYAKGLICYLGYCRLGLTGKELARYFAMSRPSVSQAIQRGEQFAKLNKIKLLN